MAKKVREEQLYSRSIPDVPEEDDEDYQDEEEELEVPQPKRFLKKQDVAKQIKKEFEEEEFDLVVNEIPQQPVRKVKQEDGSIVNLLTIDEALTDMRNDIKILKKAILGK
jgi:hypothetical protein